MFATYVPCLFMALFLLLEVPMSRIHAMMINDRAITLEQVISKYDLPENVKHFYYKRNFRPVWFKKNKLTDCGKIAFNTLSEAHEEGLDPAKYKDAVTMAKDLPSHEEAWIEPELRVTQRILE